MLITTSVISGVQIPYTQILLMHIRMATQNIEPLLYLYRANLFIDKQQNNYYLHFPTTLVAAKKNTEI